MHDELLQRAHATRCMQTCKRDDRIQDATTSDHSGVIRVRCKDRETLQNGVKIGSRRSEFVLDLQNTTTEKQSSTVT